MDNQTLTDTTAPKGNQGVPKVLSDELTTALSKLHTQDTDVLPVETAVAIVKHEERQLLVEHREGWGATTHGKAIVRSTLGALGSAVREAIANPPVKHSTEAELLSVLSGLDPDLIALCIVQQALHDIATSKDQREMSISVGNNLAGELWAAGLTEHDPKLAARIGKTVKMRHASPKQRRTAARVMAAKAKHGFKQRDWSKELKLRAGTWALNLLTQTHPDVFQWVTEAGTNERKLEITETAWDIVDAALKETIARGPVFFPMITEPRRWDQWAGCGSSDPRVDWTVTFLRTRHKDTIAASKHAMKSGTMLKATEGINVLQGVGWRINTRIMDILQRCRAEGIEVKGLPKADMEVPARTKDAEWELMDEGQRKLKRIKIDAVKRRNRRNRSERVLFDQDMIIAQQLAVHDRFYTPMNCDWRGRVYALPHFNFQREDRVRALFQFAEGEPIGEDGYYWLKVHVANCGDFDKISKRPLAERVAWCDENWSKICAIVTSPLKAPDFVGPTLGEMWLAADKPFLFLSSCFELVDAITEGPSYVAHLPVSFDGSCSGLQHLAGMTRAPEGALVNLIPQELPQDVYATVAERVKARIIADLEHEPESIEDKAVERSRNIRAMAALALAYGVDRKMCKRNVMTYAYSSKKFGMAQQLQVDLMDPLDQETLEGQHEQHPFFPFATGSKDYPSPAARYLASHIFDCIEEVVELPGRAMKYLQKLARAMAHEGKPLRWTTPVGIQWINRYHDPKLKRVEMWLHDGGVRMRSTVSVAVGDENDINKDRAANGVAPNFVHALDAAHLLLVAIAAAREGIVQIATVHDSFGCLPSRARRFNQIIREQFAEMYETHDVLAEVLQQAKCDLTQANWDKLPEGLEYGNLNIKDILNADFAFA